MMMAGDKKLEGVGARGAAITAEVQATAETPRSSLEPRDKLARRNVLQPAGKLFSPTVRSFG